MSHNLPVGVSHNPPVGVSHGLPAGVPTVPPVAATSDKLSLVCLLQGMPTSAETFPFFLPHPVAHTYTPYTLSVPSPGTAGSSGPRLCTCRCGGRSRQPRCASAYGHW